ncbi:hypothetical protein O6H91_05G065600 [Diphasiastrum complanatum]|uniref:Uncharacterized protein n=1 Tax=Diphasiastrum complanatum TaxID=34168 RepID=A0ACC2DP69_DIPCM|nr:hypothetical protein O6H91_05G065600 [Diphasiastrum complanatum]
MRTNAYDNVFAVLTPEMVVGIATQYTNETGSRSFSWFNIQYARFYEQHNISMTSYALSLIKNLRPEFISSTEVGLLTALQPAARKSGTKLIFQLLQPDDVDPSTNQSYGALLQNLTYVRSFASGILVPKDYILPVDNITLYLQPATSLVQGAHLLKLEVYALGFNNDQYPFSFNYSFDPIKEYRSFIDDPAAVDGVLSDFPTTASEAIACYNVDLITAPGTVSRIRPQSTVISHNGASGDFPGCTLLSYVGAINDGADYIDCPVQMTKDGIAICLESPDLFVSTNVASTSFLYRQSVIPGIQSSEGIFTFSLTWSEISTLKVKMYSPEGAHSGVFRNPAYNNLQGILRLSDFLDFAKNHSKVGIYIDIQNAYFLDVSENINAVTAVVSTLKQAGLSNSSNIVLESEDIAALRQLKQFLPYKLIYRIKLPESGGLVTLTDSAIAEIKQVADGAAVPRPLVEATNNDLFFLYRSPKTVERFHSFNLTVFVESLRNEFVALAFDYEADPTLELNTLIQFYGVDGVRTDFPATAKAYLNNLCHQTNRKAVQSSYSIPYIIPGYLLANIPGYAPPPLGAPAPSLLVAEPPLPPLAPASAASHPVQAPVSRPNSAVPVVPSLFGSMVVALIYSWFILLYFDKVTLTPTSSQNLNESTHIRGPKFNPEGRIGPDSLHPDLWMIRPATLYKNQLSFLRQCLLMMLTSGKQRWTPNSIL